MQFLLIGTGILLLATLVLALLVWLVLRVCGRRPSRYWRRIVFVHLALLPVHLFVTMPLVLGWVGSRWVQTRGDERDYAGPRLAVDGAWLPQSRESLQAERDGEVEVAPELLASAEASVVRLQAGDGVPLRAFLVEPRQEPPRCSVVMVHGLFRGGLELEPVGSMFRDLGAEVLLLELRNHGDSGRVPATFGLSESLDVIAAVEWLRGRNGLGQRPIVLFGVSLGTAAVSLAAARLQGLGGLVLDAPMDDLMATAHRMLGHSRRLELPQPFRSLVLMAVELWSGFDFAEVEPRAAFRELPPKMPVLLIGGGDDQRMPPAAVKTLFGELPTQPGRKELWIRPGSDHGAVWSDDPGAYREHLRAFLELVDKASKDRSR